MWTYRRVLGLGAIAWTFWTGLAALPPYGAMLWWVRARVAAPDGWLRALGFFVAFLLIRWLAATWYSATARFHGGFSLFTAGNEVMEVNARRAMLVGLWLWPTGLLLGLAAWGSGLFAGPPGGWWWVAVLLVPALQGLLLFGTAWLYTWLVVSMSRPLTVSGEHTAAGAQGLVGSASGRTRTVFGTLAYAWIACGAAAVIVTLFTGLFVLVHHVPAGYFGIGVALFVGFSVAVAGFPVAVATGLWFQLLAALYQRIGRGALQLRWREVRLPVRVE